MEMILHLPQTKEDLEQLSELAAEAHADAAIHYIMGLECSDAEKLEILELMLKQLETS